MSSACNPPPVNTPTSSARSWPRLAQSLSPSSGETLHGGRGGSWLDEQADFGRVFIGGDKAEGNISHTLATRVELIGLPQGVKVAMVIFVHPYFRGIEANQMWLYVCLTNGGLSDSRLKPTQEDLERLGCEQLLVFVAKKDHLMEMGIEHNEELKKSGWRGNVELMKNIKEECCFRNSTTPEVPQIRRVRLHYRFIAIKPKRKRGRPSFDFYS
ncbi:uncharacterized protein J3R85_020485 [Psidium guajava]|nr:uncharacterized protein J3R85_020485 [Psidium guajava]